MKFSNLGNTDIKISKIGLGTNAVGGHNLFNNLDEEQGILVIKEALNQGITFFDTADLYGFGRSEELLGETLKGKRNEVIIATKGAFVQQEDGTIRPNNQPAYLRKALEASLKRLKTDYIDLYYIHAPDGETPLEEAVGDLARLKEEGKIRTIGISNVSLEQLKEANTNHDITALEVPYSMLDRSAEKDLLPYCVENNISFVPYGPLAFGILGGKYDDNFKLDENDWRNSLPLFSGENFKTNRLKANELKKIADELGTTLPNLALAWLLSQKAIDSVIPGAKKAEQVAQNAKAADVKLSEKELIKIENILR